MKLKFRVPYWYLLFGPALAFGLGFAMNAIVMAANHGQMPVLVPGGCHEQMFAVLDDQIHTCMVAASRLKILADWIVIRKLDLVASPGDLFIWIYDKTFIYAYALWAGLIVKDYNKS